MESSCISADNTIQPSYMREAPSTLSASAYFDCDNYPSPNLDDTYWGNLIPSIPASFCNTPMETGSQQEQVVAKDEDPEFQELSDQVLDMENVYGRKLSSLGQNIPDSFCNTPMETGSQQEQVIAKDEDPEFKELADQVLDMEYEKRESMYKTEEVNVYGRKLSSLGQNIPDSFCNTPMETGSQQEQVIAKDEDPEFKKLSDQLLEWEDELLDLEDKKRESMYKTEEVNVYGRKLSSLGQNVPDSFCNTPMETGSQQTSSAWDVDCTGVEASKSAAYQSMNVLHDDTPITTDSQQKQMETKGHQRAKQLKETYNHALPTIGMELPLHSFYSSMKIAPCLGECKRTPNVSVLHDTNCVLYNMPLLQELQKNPKVLQKVKEHLTNINMDRDGFKNLLFHEKLSKMLDKIECAVKYIKHCSAKYLYLLTFKSQIKGFVKSRMPNMKKKKADFDELIHDLMQKDMSYYQLKVDIYNMLEIMSHHKYAEVVENYYHLLALESRINTFIENYKKVSESVKEKLDIQNNNPDFVSHDWYDQYNAYINELINNLDADNSFLDNNSVFVAAPIISNPHLTAFYANMNTVFANRLKKAQRSPPFLHLSRTSNIIYSLKKDLSIFLDEIEDLHVRFDKILDILASSEQSDGMLKDIISDLKDIIKEARARILYSGKDRTKSYLSVKELGRIEISSDCSSTRVICLKLCMWLSLSRGEEACKIVKQEPTLSHLCKALGNKGHCLKEYIDYKEDLIYQFKAKWFPRL